MLHLLLLRVSLTYILHDDSLEIRSGILSSRAFVVLPSGFSDLEVFRSVVGRIMDSGARALGKSWLDQSSGWKDQSQEKKRNKLILARGLPKLIAFSTKQTLKSYA